MSSRRPDPIPPYPISVRIKSAHRALHADTNADAHTRIRPKTELDIPRLLVELAPDHPDLPSAPYHRLPLIRLTCRMSAWKALCNASAGFDFSSVWILISTFVSRG